jgi:tRNA (Thr-GGU) A37 N-methylase
MVTNGSSFLFVKTVSKQYGISDIFATRSPHRNNLAEVLKILKYLGGLLVG